MYRFRASLTILVTVASMTIVGCGGPATSSTQLRGATDAVQTPPSNASPDASPPLDGELVVESQPPDSKVAPREVGVLPGDCTEKYPVRCSGRILVNKDYSGRNLTNAQFIGSDLKGANFSGADLSHADLSGADLTKANLKGANLQSASLARATLKLADFTGADLSRADLSDASLLNTNMSGANLTGAKPVGPNDSGLMGADFDWLTWFDGSTMCHPAGVYKCQ